MFYTIESGARHQLGYGKGTSRSRKVHEVPFCIREPESGLRRVLPFTPAGAGSR
jgi:hypothetical protein